MHFQRLRSRLHQLDLGRTPPKRKRSAFPQTILMCLCQSGSTNLVNADIGR